MDDDALCMCLQTPVCPPHCIKYWAGFSTLKNHWISWRARTHIFSKLFPVLLSDRWHFHTSLTKFFFFFSLKWPNIIILLLLLLLMIIIIIICTKLLKMMMWNITTVTSPVLVLLLVRISWSLSWSLSARFLSRCSCRFRSFSWQRHRHPHQSITVHSFGDFKLFSNRLLKMSTPFSFVSRRTHGCTALLFQNPLSVQRVFDFLQDAQWLLVLGRSLIDRLNKRAGLAESSPWLLPVWVWRWLHRPRVAAFAPPLAADSLSPTVTVFP